MLDKEQGKALNTEVITKAISGNHQAQAETISYLESGNNPAIVFDMHFSKIGKAHRIGITGPPGAGKSTLVSKLISQVRKSGKNCAIIACDPSSPYTQGALLGDRTRMTDHFLDPGVFIRSMATRGNLGGLAPTTSIIADFLDICDYPVIIIETVGVGQTEVDVVTKSDTVVVVMTPESGDSIQMMKAGLLEGADIFCINKFDRPGGEALEADLQFGLSLSSHKWIPPICRTIAKENFGIKELYDKINEHFETSKNTPEREQRLYERYKSEVEFWIGNFIFGKQQEQLRMKAIQSAFKTGQKPWETANSIWKAKMEETCQ